jgi:pyruvate ferredoxin oxidoreductase gamma subunit
MLEIIIQGRGGQGAQTAGYLLAQAFFSEGRHVQSFASYGGARRGTPVRSMIRVDEKPIRLRCDIENPDAVLFFDETLLDARLFNRLDRDTLIVINGAGSSNNRSLPGDHRFCFIDGIAIAREFNLGRIVNSALLGAFAGLLGTPSLSALSATILDATPVKKKENVAACRAGFELAVRQSLDTDPIQEAAGP